MHPACSRCSLQFHICRPPCQHFAAQAVAEGQKSTPKPRTVGWCNQYALPHGHKCYLHVLSLISELVRFLTQTTSIIHILVFLHCCVTVSSDGENFWRASYPVAIIQWQDDTRQNQSQKEKLSLGSKVHQTSYAEKRLHETALFPSLYCRTLKQPAA